MHSTCNYKSIIYIRNIIFCYECPYCLKKERVKSGGFHILDFICTRSHKAIKRFTFPNKILLEAFLFDLPRKFTLFGISIPEFCTLKTAVSEKKIQSVKNENRQLTLFDMEEKSDE